MGAIHKGIPPQIALELARVHKLRYFVETGTFMGRTATWAAAHFEQVVTVECSPVLFARTSLKGRNITAVLADSAAELPRVLAGLPGPALIWLDAHWSGDLGYSRPETECPVLAEVAAIVQASWRHVVMIDDARYFLAAPPKPHRGWPGYEEIMLTFGPGWKLEVREDVIIAR